MHVAMIAAIALISKLLSVLCTKSGHADCTTGCTVRTKGMLPHHSQSHVYMRWHAPVIMFCVSRAHIFATPHASEVYRFFWGHQSNTPCVLVYFVLIIPHALCYLSFSYICFPFFVSIEFVFWEFFPFFNFFDAMKFFVFSFCPSCFILRAPFSILCTLYFFGGSNLALFYSGQFEYLLVSCMLFLCLGSNYARFILMFCLTFFFVAVEGFTYLVCRNL